MGTGETAADCVHGCLQAEGVCSARDHTAAQCGHDLIMYSDRGRITIWTLLASTPTPPPRLALQRVSLCHQGSKAAGASDVSAAPALSKVWHEGHFDPGSKQHCRLALRMNVCRVPEWEERTCPQPPEVDPPGSSAADCALVADLPGNRCAAWHVVGEGLLNRRAS